MKQKKLLALTLAAAMAVTSLTLPGGVLEPETVYADADMIKPIVAAQVLKTNAGTVTVDLTELLSKYGDVNTQYVDLPYCPYIKNAQYSNGKVTFELDDSGKAGAGSFETGFVIETIKLLVGLDKGSVHVFIPFTIVPANTKIVTITLENVNNLFYDGKEKELAYNLTVNEEKLDVKTLDKEPTPEFHKDYLDGEQVAFKDAGTYAVMLKCQGSEKHCYGLLVQEVIINPAKLTEKNISDYFTIKTGDEANALTYDGKTDYTDTIKKMVTTSGDAIKAGEYDVDLTSNTVDNGVSQASKVTVKIKVTDGNFTTDDTWVELGTVTIAKAKPVDVLNVTDDGKGNLTVKMNDKEVGTDKFNIGYYAEDGTTELGAKPTANGEYVAKITMKDLANFTTDAKEYTYKISKSESSSSSSSTDSSKDTSSTTTTASGTTVTTTEEKNTDGTATVEKKLENKTTGENATVTVEKNASGKVTEVAAEVTEKSAEGETTISAATVADIKEAAGTDDVTITTKTVDADGNVLREVSVNASDLIAGKKLKVVEVNKETGEETLVNASTYKVAADGSLSLDDLGNASYELVSTAAEKALTNKVLKTVKVAKASATVAAGKKTTIKLSKKLNMDNVKKVIYTSTKKSVATVSKTGKITAKKAGKVTIKAKIVLNNGKTKIVSMKIKVKAKK